ncbi:MAG: metallophosphoesterase family protein, partial [Verrucomicrobiota bacterium]
RLAESGAYDAVFSGHDHQRYFHQIGETLWANPGEIMGRFGTPSIGIFDSESGHFSHLDL